MKLKSKVANVHAITRKSIASTKLIVAQAHANTKLKVARAQASTKLKVAQARKSMTEKIVQSPLCSNHSGENFPSPPGKPRHKHKYSTPLEKELEELVAERLAYQAALRKEKHTPKKSASNPEHADATEIKSDDEEIVIESPRVPMVRSKITGEMIPAPPPLTERTDGKEHHVKLPETPSPIKLSVSQKIKRHSINLVAKAKELHKTQKIFLEKQQKAYNDKKKFVTDSKKKTEIPNADSAKAKKKTEIPNSDSDSDSDNM